MAIFSPDKNVIDNNQSINTQVSDDFLLLSTFKVFYYNHVPPPTTTAHDAIPYQKICYALSEIRVSFNEGLVFSQFWGAIGFGSDTVLTTRGQPFAFSMYTCGFWSYRLACLDHNSYVNQGKGKCIGLPSRVFHNLSPEWVQDVEEYKDKDYPQRLVAMRSNIQGSFAIPVFDGDRCIGVLEFVMTNCVGNVFSKMEEVCKALEKAGLQSSDPNKCINIKEAGLQLSDQNESINIDTSKKASRKRKADDITRDDVTKLFGLPKSCAAKRYKMSDNTFSTVHKRDGIDIWPCKANNTVKSSAHVALIDGIASEISPDEARLLKWINSELMNDDDIIRTLEQADSRVDEYRDSLTSTDHESVGHPDMSARPVLLEMYRR
uniref:protein NLP1-like n=1 Tax=Erigeron canadensis TaxID=72917 RepID=UPI001CB92978|nr:protein NLP1-like [Erigeron canadensis]